MTDLPRYTIAVTLTKSELTRLDELAALADVKHDAILLSGLAVLDKLVGNTPDYSIFERKGNENPGERTGTG